MMLLLQTCERSLTPPCTVHGSQTHAISVSLKTWFLAWIKGFIAKRHLCQKALTCIASYVVYVVQCTQSFLNFMVSTAYPICLIRLELHTNYGYKKARRKSLLQNLTFNTSIDVNFRNYHSQRFKHSKDIFTHRDLQMGWKSIFCQSRVATY